MGRLEYILGLGGLIGAFLIGSPKIAKAQEGPLYGPTEETKYSVGFGNEEKTLRTRDDYLKFGEKLQKKSEEEEGSYEEFLEDKALEYLKKSYAEKAYQSIVAIHRDDINDFPKQKRHYQEELVNAYEDWIKKLYRNPEEKNKRQQELCQEYFNLGKILEEENEFGEAVNVLKKAQSLARDLKLPEETQAEIRLKYDVNYEANNALRVFYIHKKRADDNPEDESSNFRVGEYYFNLGQFELAKPYLEKAGENGTKYLELLRQIELTKQDGQKESEHGLTKEVIEQLSEAIKGKEKETIESLLHKFEVEDSLWYDIRKASYLLRQENDGAYSTLSELEKKAQELLEKGEQKDISGDFYLKLGNEFVSLLQEQSRKREKIVLMQNALMYCEAAAKKLDPGSKELKDAKELSEALENKLVELGGSKKDMDFVVVGGKVWHFDTDENCMDFVKNWTVPGGEWKKIGPMHYFNEGNPDCKWEIRDKKLFGKLYIFFNERYEDDVTFKMDAQGKVDLGIILGAKSKTDFRSGYIFIFGQFNNTKTVISPFFETDMKIEDINSPNTIIAKRLGDNILYLINGKHVFNDKIKNIKKGKDHPLVGIYSWDINSCFDNIQIKGESSE